MELKKLLEELVRYHDLECSVCPLKPFCKDNDDTCMFTIAKDFLVQIQLVMTADTEILTVEEEKEGPTRREGMCSNQCGTMCMEDLIGQLCDNPGCDGIFTEVAQP